jgi:DNA (cytosine-5)-methyltransferase 1
MGWDTIAWCEIEPFCQKVLNYHFPNAKQHNDIKTTDFTIYRGKCGLLTGGFPCQPYSISGKRKGKEDNRHLWPEMHRAIREIQPRWIVAENVYGLINWNRGMVFNEVQTDLEASGYEVWPYVLPACAVNAPHLRNRIFFVASNSNSNIRCKGRLYEAKPEKTEGYISSCDARHFRKETWDNFPTQSPVCSRDDGLPNKLDGITFSKWKNESIKAYGNAVVVPLVLQIFKAINLFEKRKNPG